MKRLLVYLTTILFKIYTTICGTTEAKEIFNHNRIVLSLEINITETSKIVIHCRKRQYIRNLKAGFFRGKIYTVFDVYSEIDETIPLELKNAFSVSTSFPPIVSLYVEDRIHAKILINSYLEMIRNKLVGSVDLDKVVIH